MTALRAGQLSPDGDLLAIELHSRPVSPGKREVGPLMGKLGEMLLRASLQMGVWFSFRLELKRIKELWVVLHCGLGGFSAGFQLTLTPRRDGSASWAALTSSFSLVISC